MNVTCPECGTVYRVDPRKVPSTGVFARCARCPAEFAIAVPAGEELAAGSTLAADPAVAGIGVTAGVIPEDTWSVQGMDEAAWARSETEESGEQPPAEADYGDSTDDFAYAEAGAEPAPQGSAEYGDTLVSDALDTSPEPPAEPEAWEATPAYVPDESVSDVSPARPDDDFDQGGGEPSAYGVEDRSEEAAEQASAEAVGWAEQADHPDYGESESGPSDTLAELQAADADSGYGADVDLETETAYHPAASAESEDAALSTQESWEEPPPPIDEDGAATVGVEEVASGGVAPTSLPEEEALSAGFAAAPVRPTSDGELPPPPFGSTDPHARARRLARALVSDIVVYHPDRRERSLREGTLRQEFREEIRKSWDEYVAHVGEQFARDTTYFRDALNELLAGGARLF